MQNLEVFRNLENVPQGQVRQTADSANLRLDSERESQSYYALLSELISFSAPTGLDCKTRTQESATFIALLVSRPVIGIIR